MRKWYNKLAYASAAGLGTAAAVMPVALASSGNGIQTSNILKSLLQYVFKIFRYIGLILVAWGIGQLVLAFKNDDADSKSRAIMTIVAAAMLFGLGELFRSLNIAGMDDVQDDGSWD